MGTSNFDGNQNSAMDLTRSQNQKPFILSAPKMLTPSEEDWLRQNLKETVELAQQIYRSMYGQQEEDKAA